MNKEEFIKIANITIKEQERLEKADLHLFELCDKEFTFAPRLNSDIITDLIQLLDEELGEDWFSCWICGNRREVSFNGKEYYLSTLDQLWDFVKLC